MDLLFPLLSALLGILAFAYPKLVSHSGKIVTFWSFVVFFSTLIGSLQSKNIETPTVIWKGIFSTSLSDSVYLLMANIARLAQPHVRLTWKGILRLFFYFMIGVVSLRILQAL